MAGVQRDGRVVVVDERELSMIVRTSDAKTEGESDVLAHTLATRRHERIEDHAFADRNSERRTALSLLSCLTVASKLVWS